MQSLLGDPGTRRSLRQAVARLVRLRRYEHMSVQHALHRVRASQMHALQPGESRLMQGHLDSTCWVAAWQQKDVKPGCNLSDSLAPLIGCSGQPQLLLQDGLPFGWVQAAWESREAMGPTQQCSSASSCGSDGCWQSLSYPC